MLDKIKAIILEDYCVANIKGGKYLLKEDTIGASCKEVLISGKHDYIVFKFDQKVPNVNHLFPFYSKEKRISAMCDYVIFYKQDNTNDLLAVICNLKSNNSGNNADQVKAGEIFARFIFDTAKRYYSGDSSFHNLELFNFKVLFSSKIIYRNDINYLDGTVKNQNGILNLIADDQFNIDEWYRFKTR